MDTYEKLMNQKIKAYYGYGHDSHPRFRLAFSDNLTEKREIDGELVIAPKYNYINGRWILEIHFPQSQDHYEPLWLWTTNKGEYYQPKIEDVQFIITRVIDQIINPIKQNMKQVEAADEADKQKEIEKIFDTLQQENTFLGQQLKEKEAVSFANVKEFKDGK
jgi:hypothetical protein